MKEVQHGGALELGIPELDTQHQRLLSLARKMCEHVHRGEFSAAHVLLDELIEGKQEHSQYEEALLKQAGYPFHRAHSKTHQQFLQQCGFLKQRIARGDFLRQHEVDYLQQWIHKHIQGDDGDYVTYLKTQAVAQDEEVPWHLRTLNRFFPGRGK